MRSNSPTTAKLWTVFAMEFGAGASKASWRALILCCALAPFVGYTYEVEQDLSRAWAVRNISAAVIVYLPMFLACLYGGNLLASRLNPHTLTTPVSRGTLLFSRALAALLLAMIPALVTVASASVIASIDAGNDLWDYSRLTLDESRENRFSKPLSRSDAIGLRIIGGRAEYASFKANLTSRPSSELPLKIEFTRTINREGESAGGDIFEVSYLEESGNQRKLSGLEEYESLVLGTLPAEAVHDDGSVYLRLAAGRGDQTPVIPLNQVRIGESQQSTLISLLKLALLALPGTILIIAIGAALSSRFTYLSSVLVCLVLMIVLLLAQATLGKAGGASSSMLGQLSKKTEHGFGNVISRAVPEVALRDVRQDLDRNEAIHFRPAFSTRMNAWYWSLGFFALSFVLLRGREFHGQDIE